jgi:uncharacterized membrane protein HdeD (DUF308 family)
MKRVAIVAAGVAAIAYGFILLGAPVRAVFAILILLLGCFLIPLGLLP